MGENNYSEDWMITQNLYSKFGRIFDLMPELIFVLDEKGIIADYNRTAAQLIGRDDLTGKQMTSIVPEGRQPEFLSYLTSDGKRFDSQFLTGKAKALDVSVQIKSLESMEKTFSVVIAQDMTEQKQRDLDYLRFSNVIERTINPIQITDARG